PSSTNTTLSPVFKLSFFRISIGIVICPFEVTLEISIMFPPFLTFLTTVILPQLEKKRAYSHAVKFSPPGWRALHGMSDNVCRLPTAMDLKAQTGPQCDAT